MEFFKNFLPRKPTGKQTNTERPQATPTPSKHLETEPSKANDEFRALCYFVGIASAIRISRDAFPGDPATCTSFGEVKPVLKNALLEIAAMKLNPTSNAVLGNEVFYMLRAEGKAGEVVGQQKVAELALKAAQKMLA